MNTFTLDTPISEFVTANTESARVFEQLGLDYCCGGKKPLWEACKERGLDPEAVLHDLVAEAGEPAAGSWQRPAARTLSALTVEIVETHHTYLRHEIPRITALLERVVRRHGDRHPELKLIQEAFADFASDLCQHMLKEEGILFPAIRQIEAGGSLETFPLASIKDPIQALVKTAMEVEGVGPCDAVLGYYWDGTSCQALSGCSCEGPDCDRLTALEECAAAHERCPPACIAMDARGAGSCEAISSAPPGTAGSAKRSSAASARARTASGASGALRNAWR